MGKERQLTTTMVTNMLEQTDLLTVFCDLFCILKTEVDDCIYKHDCVYRYTTNELCDKISFRKPSSAGRLLVVNLVWNEKVRELEYDPYRISRKAVLAMLQVCAVNNIEHKEIDAHFRLISSKFPD
jgi:hypothetical protein